MWFIISCVDASPSSTILIPSELEASEPVSAEMHEVTVVANYVSSSSKEAASQHSKRSDKPARLINVVKRRKKVEREPGPVSDVERRADFLLKEYDEVPSSDSGWNTPDDDDGFYDLLASWISLVQRNPQFEPLFIVFMSYFCATASAAGPERIFRISGLIFTALRSRLSTDMLRMLVFLRKNKEFVPSVFEVVEEYWCRRRQREAERRKRAKEGQRRDNLLQLKFWPPPLHL